jgi:SAM-dependent methyltransferase
MAEWLSEWLPSARSGRALEIGAGTGLFTKHLFPWSGSVTASDLSPEMCRVGRIAVPEADWIMMAAERPAAGPWDWIFSSSMLQWASDPAEIFSAWRECLAPGGRAMGGVFVAGSLAEWNALAGDASPLVWRTPEEWRSYLAGAGFRLLREQCEKRVFHYRSALALLRSVHDIGGAPHRRFAAGRLRQHLREYDARFRSPDGVSASWMFYRFEADLKT